MVNRILDMIWRNNELALKVGDLTNSIRQRC
jgi:hypothetical protein